MAKPSFSGTTTLNGIIIRSTVDSGIIDSIKLPDLSGRFVTVEAKDIRGDNRVKVGSDYIPLLSSNKISYKGQPVLALFGFDSESVQLKAHDIDISYRLAESGPKAEETIPFSWSFGEIEEETKEEGILSFTQSYDLSRLNSPDSSITRIKVGMEEGNLHVHAPTQWVFHMRDTISDITKIPKKNIVIHTMPFFAPHDEMLLTPSILASIAALASLKSNYPVEIQDSYPVFRPSMHIERKSWYMGDGKPIAEDIRATVDQGAYPLFAEELAREMAAGFYPPCDMKAVRISIDCRESDQSPACFYGDLGYSEALATTEFQWNMIAHLSGISPETWKSQFCNASAGRNKLISCASFARMKEGLSAVVRKSDFARKYAAYDCLRTTRGKYSSFFGYARGIAAAIAPGIAGFSKSMRGIAQTAVQITLYPGGKVKVNTSFATTGNSAKIWKRLICEKLGVRESDISFPADGDELVDSGPSVLASNSGRMPLLIEKTCDLIKEKRFVNPLPLCEGMSGFKGIERGEGLFISNSWVSMVLELHLDTVSFIPVVRHIWVQIQTGRLFDPQAFRQKIRHTIVTTLQENGATLAHSKNLTVDVALESVSEDLSSSVTSAVRSVSLSTFASALAQALGTNEFSLPITSEIIMRTILKRRKA